MPADPDRPQRLQLRRTKGWRKPADAVTVARPSRWGNDFRVGGTVALEPYGGRGAVEVPDRATAVALYEHWQLPLVAETARAELAGHDLACWCPLDGPCHAEVLLRVANE